MYEDKLKDEIYQATQHQAPLKMATCILRFESTKLKENNCHCNCLLCCDEVPRKESASHPRVLF